MALGSKIGKIFGAIGSGLSFVPGPWSILGPILGAAGGIAGDAADMAKQKREGEQEEPQQQTQPAAQPDPSRPEQAQIEPSQPAPVLGPQRQAPIPQNKSFYPDVRTQMQQEIANMILRGSDPGGL